MNAANFTEIKCVMFCDFHAEYGPRIVCQSPENFISKEIFDSVSVYIIPKPEIQRRVITNTILFDEVLSDNLTTTGDVTASSADVTAAGCGDVTCRGLKFIGYPNSIEHRRYTRNAFMFNVCVVCEHGRRTLPYEPIVRKVSEWLEQQERHTCLLSGPDVTRKMSAVLRRMRDSLNNNGRAVLHVDGGVSVHLKLVRAPQSCSVVLDESVPVWLGRRPAHLSLWDMTSQQVVPHIDGTAHVAKIAVLADVQVQLVKACISNLLYYGLVELISIFQYSNSYTLTSGINRLYTDKQLQTECALKVARKTGVPACVGGVFRVFCALSHNKSVRDVCMQFNLHALNIDERRLVQFGLLQGIIRRVHKYPVLLSDSCCDSAACPASSSSGSSSSAAVIGGRGGLDGPARVSSWLAPLLDGSHSLDAVCVRAAAGGAAVAGVKSRLLEEAGEGDARVVLLWK